MSNPQERDATGASSLAGTSNAKAKSESTEEEQQLYGQFHPGSPTRFQELGSRAVRDPVTGRQVRISDAHSKHESRQKPEHAASAASSSSSSSEGAAEEPESNDTRYNILLHTFPAPPNASLIASPLLKKLDTIAWSSAAAFAAAQGLVYVLPVPRPVSLALSAASAGAIYIYAHSAKVDAQRALDLFASETSINRAHKFSPPSPESAEWLNGLVQGIWELIDTKLFEPALDMVEDIMQQSIPQAIFSDVKIKDVSQGSNPFRVVYLRRLPDKEASEKGKDLSRDADDVGTCVNYECEVSYSARPGKDIKHHNIHLLLELFMSLKDLFNIPISVWAQLESFHATIRLRIELTESPPYIGKVLFTFMGLPKVGISVQPLNRALPNVVDMPILHDFVQDSIAAACNAYVAPKSMTVDVGEILAGSGVKLDTDAIGVLQIDIHRGEDFEGKDATGTSDPFLVCSFASLGRALYTTRVLKKDLNPVWEETCFILVSANDLKANEELLLMLWDEDKPSDDDLLGRIRVPLKELVQDAHQDRSDPLMKLTKDRASKGTLYWSSHFHGKSELLRPQPKKVENPENAESNVQQGSGAAATSQEVTAAVAPMDMNHLSGILSVTIHEAHRVEKQRNADDDPDKEDLPSPYAVVLLNDERVFKTRTKQYTNRAAFNKTDEFFVRNWETSEVTVILKDARAANRDLVLGKIGLPLKDCLNGKCQSTELRSIGGGHGHGRISVSLLFRSINAQLPKSLLAADSGKLRISSLSFHPKDSHQLPSSKIRLSTKFDNHKLPRHASTSESDGSTTWKLQEPLELAFRNRFSARLSFEFGRGLQIAGIGKDAEALSVLRLQRLADNDHSTLDLKVFTGDDLEDYQEHVLSDERTIRNHSLTEIGTLKCEIESIPMLHATPLGKGDEDDEEAGSESVPAPGSSAANAAPDGDRPVSPSGSFRKSLKDKTRHFRDMFKHSDSEGE